MDKESLTAWALANGWRIIAGHPSLTKPAVPKEPIVRLVMLATVVNLEVKKPAGKWEKIGGAAYGAVEADSEGGLPSGIGLEKVPSITRLMQQNKDAQVFARMTGMKP